MNISLDARKILDFGIGTYVRNLLEWYSRIPNGHRWFPIFDPDEAGLFRYPDSFTPCSSRAGKYSVAEHLEIPRIVRRVRAELFHCTHYVSPVFGNTPMVVNVHDLIHLIFPQYLPSGAARLYSRLMFEHSVRRARVIIAISEWTKKDLMRLLGVPEKKIRVTYLAADERFKRRPEKEWRPVLKSAFGICDPYILFVGNMKPHKNVANLIRAFRLVPEGQCRHLVLVGSGWQKDPGLKGLAGQFGLGGRIMVKENVPIDRLNALYNGAEMLVHPSAYEGFGLPPVEAMSAGIPVAAARASCLPEICGDAAVYFQPSDHEEMAEVIRQLLKNTDLRRSCIQKGFARAGRFSWRKTAEETLKIYGEAA
jgi:glycosyltransferase involved in cell wall biosynthesis